MNCKLKMKFRKQKQLTLLHFFTITYYLKSRTRKGEEGVKSEE